MEKIKNLPWNQIQRDQRANNYFWDRISPEELEERIMSYPLSKELIEGALTGYIGRIIYLKKGYLLMPTKREFREFTLYLEENPSNPEIFEIATIHELTHLIYRIQGNFLSDSEENNSIEKILEKTSLEFQKNNPGYITEKLDELFE